MKRIIIILAVLLLSAPLFAEDSAVVKEVNGRVQIQVPGGQWENAGPGDELPSGASISTGFGSSAILDVGASTLSVDALTRMKLEELIQSQGNQTTGLFLRVGKVKAEVKRDQGLSHNFRLRSPSSTAAVRGTKFSFNGNDVEVDEGSVALVANAIAREILLAAGETGKVGSNGKTSSALAERIIKASTQASTVKQENGNAQSGASQTSGLSTPPAGSGGAADVKLYGDINITVK